MAYTRKTSDIITSYDLEHVLEQIKDNSEVARLLLKQRHSIENLVDNHINYISISNSDKTKISYLTQERVDSLNEKGEDLWTSPKRFHIKPGAFVSKIFRNIHPREVENFSQLFKNVQTKMNSKFRVISGDSILHYYYHGSYFSESGSLGNSCMKYHQCQDYLNLYTENKNQISMVILVADNYQLIGRALLWNVDDIKIMDRIYTIDDESYQFHFKKWADENGYWYKKEQKWNNSLFFESKGKTIFKEITFRLENFIFNKYPYMDTFKFLNISTGQISNFKPETNSQIKTLSSADGSYYSHDHLVMCEKSKLFYNFTETTYLEYLGIRVWCGLTVYSDIFDTSILNEDALFDDSINDWIFKDGDLNNNILIEKVKKDREKNKTILNLDLLTNLYEYPVDEQLSPF